MRFVIAALLCAVCGSTTLAYELTEEQKGPWRALEEQVAHYIKKDWKEHIKYIHPQASIWGDFAPAPLSAVKSDAYNQMFEEGQPNALAHHLVPVEVVVAGDVAIINFYIHVLTKPEGESKEVIFRGHNTWKKENGKWLLLAIYNTKVKSADDE